MQGRIGVSLTHANCAPWMRSGCRGRSKYKAEEALARRTPGARETLLLAHAHVCTRADKRIGNGVDELSGDSEIADLDLSGRRDEHI